MGDKEKGPSSTVEKRGPSPQGAKIDNKKALKKLDSNSLIGQGKSKLSN